MTTMQLDGCCRKVFGADPQYLTGLQPVGQQINHQDASGDEDAALGLVQLSPCSCQCFIGYLHWELCCRPSSVH